MVVIINASKQPTYMPLLDVMQGDKNSKVIRYIIPAMADGVDLTGLKWQVDVFNANSEEESIPVQGLINGDHIECEWKVGGIATSAEGIATFQLSGANGDIVWQAHPAYLNVHKEQAYHPRLHPRHLRRWAVRRYDLWKGVM